MDDLEKAFLNNLGDAYAIYQLKHTQDTRDLRFASMSQVQMAGKTIDREKYELLYIGDLPWKEQRPPGEVLEEIYARFNFMKPGFFTGHSLSMSDIVGLKQNGRITFHYVDSFGFHHRVVGGHLCHYVGLGLFAQPNHAIRLGVGHRNRRR